MKFDIKDDGRLIHIFVEDKFICSMPPKIAREISHWLAKKAGRIEELENVARLVQDQAILERAGTGVGLTSNPRILQEAHKEAQWDSLLRKRMPLKGIEPTSVVGIPCLSHSSKPS